MESGIERRADAEGIGQLEAGGVSADVQGPLDSAGPTVRGLVILLPINESFK